MPRSKTNIDIVTEIMSVSKFGALSQMFVIDALTKHAETVAKADPKTFDNSLVNGKAWVGVAAEIRDRLDAFYSRRKVA